MDRLNHAPAVCFFICVIYDKLHKDIFLYGQVESFTCIVVVCLWSYTRIYFLYGQVELFTCIVFK